MKCKLHPTAKTTQLFSSWICDVCEPPKQAEPWTFILGTLAPVAAPAPLKSGTGINWTILGGGYTGIRDASGYLLCHVCVQRVLIIHPTTMGCVMTECANHGVSLEFKLYIGDKLATSRGVYEYNGNIWVQNTAVGALPTNRDPMGYIICPTCQQRVRTINVTKTTTGHSVCLAHGKSPEFQFRIGDKLATALGDYEYDGHNWKPKAAVWSIGWARNDSYGYLLCPACGARAESAIRSTPMAPWTPVCSNHGTWPIKLATGDTIASSVIGNNGMDGIYDVNLDRWLDIAPLP